MHNERNFQRREIDSRSWRYGQSCRIVSCMQIHARVSTLNSTTRYWNRYSVNRGSIITNKCKDDLRTTVASRSESVERSCHFQFATVTLTEVKRLAILFARIHESRVCTVEASTYLLCLWLRAFAYETRIFGPSSPSLFRQERERSVYEDKD